jgi:L-aspartate oxidase
VFGARAARAAAAEPSEPDHPDRPAQPQPPPLTQQSREALWRYAGLERDGEGLARLTADPHPLVRLIARSALARQESRGAHLRRDFPGRHPELDGHHVTVTGASDPVLEPWH